MICHCVLITRLWSMWNWFPSHLWNLSDTLNPQNCKTIKREDSKGHTSAMTKLYFSFAVVLMSQEGLPELKFIFLLFQTLAHTSHMFWVFQLFVCIEIRIYAMFWTLYELGNRAGIVFSGQSAQWQKPKLCMFLTTLHMTIQWTSIPRRPRIECFHWLQLTHVTLPDFQFSQHDEVHFPHTMFHVLPRVQVIPVNTCVTPHVDFQSASLVILLVTAREWAGELLLLSEVGSIVGE